MKNGLAPQKAALRTQQLLVQSAMVAIASHIQVQGFPEAESASREGLRPGKTPLGFQSDSKLELAAY